MTTQKYVKLKNNGGYEGMEHFDYSTILPVKQVWGDEEPAVMIALADLVKGGAAGHEFVEPQDAVLPGLWPFFVGEECEFVEVQDGE